MKNNPDLLTDVDAFVADIKDEKVLAKLKGSLEIILYNADFILTQEGSHAHALSNTLYTSP